MNKRDTVKKIKAGSVEIGGGAPVSVQTMCNTKTWDVDATVAQIKAMQTAGADIVRIALPDMESAKAVSAIKEQVSVPLVADIHFDYRLALEAAERGIDKIRINPGNIGAPENVKAVAEACRRHNIPIRAASKRVCSKSTATPVRKLSSRALRVMRSCSSAMTLTISAFR